MKTRPERTVGAPRFLGCCTVLAWAWASVAMAYVNGGDFKSTHQDYEKSLLFQGWGVSAHIPKRNEAKLTQPQQQDINQWVGSAIRGIKEPAAEEISPEVKREIAAAAADAINKGLSESRQVLVDGKAGPLHYRVGTYAYEQWWETNYRGRTETHALRKKLAVFVAVGLKPLEIPVTVPELTPTASFTARQDDAHPLCLTCAGGRLWMTMRGKEEDWLKSCSPDGTQPETVLSGQGVRLCSGIGYDGQRLLLWDARIKYGKEMRPVGTGSLLKIGDQERLESVWRLPDELANSMARIAIHKNAVYAVSRTLKPPQKEAIYRLTGDGQSEHIKDLEYFVLGMASDGEHLWLSVTEKPDAIPTFVQLGENWEIAATFAPKERVISLACDGDSLWAIDEKYTNILRFPLPKPEVAKK